MNNLKGPSNMSLGQQSNLTSGQRLTDYANHNRPSAMMNNFAGPSDSENFNGPIVDDDMMYDENGMPVMGGTESDGTPFMGNHVVKTVRNLRMR